MAKSQFEKTKVTVGLAFTLSRRVMTMILTDDKIGGQPLNGNKQQELDEAFSIIIMNKLRKNIG